MSPVPRQTGKWPSCLSLPGLVTALDAGYVRGLRVVASTRPGEYRGGKQNTPFSGNHI